MTQALVEKILVSLVQYKLSLHYCFFVISLFEWVSWRNKGESNFTKIHGKFWSMESYSMLLDRAIYDVLSPSNVSIQSNSILNLSCIFLNFGSIYCVLSHYSNFIHVFTQRQKTSPNFILQITKLKQPYAKSWVTQLLNNKARIQLQSDWIQSICS